MAQAMILDIPLLSLHECAAGRVGSQETSIVHQRLEHTYSCQLHQRCRDQVHSAAGTVHEVNAGQGSYASSSDGHLHAALEVAPAAACQLRLHVPPQGLHCAGCHVARLAHSHSSQSGLCRCASACMPRAV